MNKDKPLSWKESRMDRGLRVRRNNDDVFCRRITVPVCATNHLQNAIVVFASLLDELKDIDQSDISDVRKITLMQDSIVDSSKSLKGAADYCIELPNAPEVSFRRTR
mgnify:FL=1|tara:strand:- start:174 stop:494 length:321 start_codon:yes stop_codon:yes gene_type:complete